MDYSKRLNSLMTKVGKYEPRVKQAIKTRYNYNKRISEWSDYSFDDTLA